MDTVLHALLDAASLCSPAGSALADKVSSAESWLCACPGQYAEAYRHGCLDTLPGLDCKSAIGSLWASELTHTHSSCTPKVHAASHHD